MTLSLPRALLHAEGFALLAAATTFFALSDASWWLYAALFFAPDLAMIAYGAGAKAGAVAYNALHATAAPLALTIAGEVGHWTTLTAIGLVWLAHIGFDRMLGYGLKYPAGFKETHLQRV